MIKFNFYLQFKYRIFEYLKLRKHFKTDIKNTRQMSNNNNRINSEDHRG